jgi:hypothetical protein
MVSRAANPAANNQLSHRNIGGPGGSYFKKDVSMIKSYGRCAVDIEQVVFVSASTVILKDGTHIVDPHGDFDALIAAFNSQQNESSAKPVTININ